MELQSYSLDFGWEISVPQGWLIERKEQGSCMFFPDNPEDETTIYTSAFHSEHKGILTPEYTMKESFERTIPVGAQNVEIFSELHSKAFFVCGDDDTYRIGAGFFTDGNLLSINIYARDAEKARAASLGLSQIKFRRGGNNGL